MSSRRSFLQGALGLGAGLFTVPKLFGQQHQHPSGSTAGTGRRGRGVPGRVYTPDVPDLPYTMDNGVKVFHLIAEPVRRELIPGRVMDVWGYNGSCPGPTIQVTQGDRVRIILENRLPEATSMHWHGFEIPIEMDGMPYISQKPIPPGGKFTYEFTLNQAGTFFYHSHGAMQEMMGMIGMFIMHPKQDWAPRVDHDFGIVLQEWAILPNNTVPNTMAMEFNWLTFNGKAGPAPTPLLVRHNSRVRIRLVNLGMDHHPIHLHGHTFYVTGTEGGRQPEVTWGPGNTVLVGVAQSRDIEFVANNLGDWMVHCHLPHHMMNNMASTVGPVTRSQGMGAGGGMEQGMGMVFQGHAMSDEYGPAIGRGLGVNPGGEQPTSVGPLSTEHAQGGHGAHAPVSQEANKVPGFPQDAFMEMPMDQAVDKVENYGLAKNWTAGMMGMMTLLRVLPDDKYDKIMAMVRERDAKKPASGHNHGL